MMATGATGAHEKARTSDWTQPEENSSSIKADAVGTADCSSPWRRRQQSTMKTVTTRTTGSATCNSCVSSATITCMGTHPRQDVLMTRAISLRSRVPGNWQARFWRPVERGDPSAEFNQPHGDHFTGPEVGLGMCGDGVQLVCRSLYPVSARGSAVSVPGV